MQTIPLETIWAPESNTLLVCIPDEAYGLIESVFYRSEREYYLLLVSSTATPLNLFAATQKQILPIFVEDFKYIWEGLQKDYPSSKVYGRYTPELTLRCRSRQYQKEMVGVGDTLLTQEDDILSAIELARAISKSKELLG